MAGDLKWTSQLGGAFAVDRGAVFGSIQRLRAKSQAAGNLKSTPQQTVETQTTRSMTFVVNQDGVVYEKDLGPETPAAVKAITRYDPDETWRPAQVDSGRP